MSNFFITGIGTDVGKTVVAAIITQALKADYWKPIQSGLETTDHNTVKSLVKNDKTQFYPEAYRLNTPMSPHESAAIDGVTIDLSKIKRPKTSNTLVIEGAGGLLVPLNNSQVIADLIVPTDKVILVSSGYLGSINHTLLTVEALNNRNLNCAGIIYNHIDLAGTISIIEKRTGLPTLGIMERHDKIDAHIINHYAQTWQDALLAL